MTEYELLQKLRSAKQALEDYNKEHKTLNSSSIWYDDIKKELPEILAKSHVLGASGRPCSKCGGSGREN